MTERCSAAPSLKSAKTCATLPLPKQRPKSFSAAALCTCTGRTLPRSVPSSFGPRQRARVWVERFSTRSSTRRKLTESVASASSRGFPTSSFAMDFARLKIAQPCPIRSSRIARTARAFTVSRKWLWRAARFHEYRSSVPASRRSSSCVSADNFEKGHLSEMHMTGAWILLIFVVLATAVMLLLLHLTRLGDLVHTSIPDRPRRRLFLASVSFFVTFLGVRLLVASITHHIGPFGWVEVGGRHIHHLVWGIFLLLLVGYAWLAEAGSGDTPKAIFVRRLLALLYGAGAALTLDEFALWLNLANVYWSPEGRESIDAVILFGAALAAGAWGAPFFSSLGRRRQSGS